MLTTVYGPDALPTMTATLEQVEALMQLRDPAQPVTPEDLLRFTDAFCVANGLSARAEHVLDPESPIAVESMARRGWMLLTHNGGIMGIQGLQLGTSLVDLGLQEMERGLFEDDPSLVRWCLACLSILARMDAPALEQARRGVEVAQAAVRQRLAGSLAVSGALQVAQRMGGLTPEEIAEQALFAMQEFTFGMAPAVMGFWQRRLELGSDPAHDLHRAFTDATIGRRTLEKDPLAVLSQLLAGRDPAALAMTQDALAAQRAERDRIVADLSALDPTFGANVAGATLSLAGRPG